MLVVNLLLLPIRPVTVYSHHSRPCLFPQLNPCHRTSTSIDGSVPAQADATSGSLEVATLIPQTVQYICYGSQTGHSLSSTLTSGSD